MVASVLLLQATDHDQLPYGQLRNLCEQRGNHKKETKAALRTRLVAMYATSEEPADGGSNKMETSKTVLGKRTRTMGDTMDTSTAVAGYTEKRPRSGALEIALAVDLEVAKDNAQWWNPEPKPQVEEHRSSAVEGADGAVSAWDPDECHRALGQELLPEEAEQHAELVQGAKLDELDAWKKSDVFEPQRQTDVSKQIAQTR